MIQMIQVLRKVDNQPRPTGVGICRDLSGSNILLGGWGNATKIDTTRAEYVVSSPTEDSWIILFFPPKLQIDFLLIRDTLQGRSLRNREVLLSFEQCHPYGFAVTGGRNVPIWIAELVANECQAQKWNKFDHALSRLILSDDGTLFDNNWAENISLSGLESLKIGSWLFISKLFWNYGKYLESYIDDASLE